jgi:cell division protein FtsB
VQQTPPSPAADPKPYVYTMAPPGTPTSQQELRTLRVKRSMLSDQLVSAADRRKTLAEQLKTADPSSRAGLEARMKVLDERIVRLETELDRTGDQLANAPAILVASTAAPEMANRVAEDLVPIVAILSVFVFAPFAIAFARLIWKRASASARPAVDQATQQRLEQLQQAVDTIAVEVERISEGQRFVTRILSERERPGLGAGAAEAVRAPKKSAIPTERG